MDILDLQKWAYIDGLPSQKATVSELFQKYSGISDNDIEHHLLHIVRSLCTCSVRAAANIVIPCCSGNMPGLFHDILS